MPWVTLNDNLQDLPGHGDAGDKGPVSPILVKFWDLFSGDTVIANEPELWRNSCNTTIVWRVDDPRVRKFLISEGLAEGSAVLLCPHQVMGISYDGPVKIERAKPMVLEPVGKKVVRRKFRHEE